MNKPTLLNIIFDDLYVPKAAPDAYVWNSAIEACEKRVKERAALDRHDAERRALELAAAEKMRAACVESLRDIETSVRNGSFGKYYEADATYASDVIGVIIDDIQSIDPATVVGSPEPRCVWTPDGDGHYDTSCGHHTRDIHTGTNGSPAIDAMVFCCTCGKRIEVKNAN